MKKLAIITTHPIQYYAPVFKLLHQRGNIGIKVFYTWGESSINKHDPGFNKNIEWDVPLLDGYPYEWVKNTSKRPGTHHFNGIINPGLINQVKAWQPDAVLVYGWALNSHLKVIRYFKGKIAVFFRGDSTLLDETRGAKSLLRTIFLRWVYHHIHHAFYVGTNSKAYFKKYGLTDAQLDLAPHAIDNKRFAEDKTGEAQLLRRQLSIPNTDIVILFAGKMEEKKAPLLLLEAFFSLNKQGTHLLFTGNGPLEDELKLKAKGNANVHFIGFQNQSRMPVVYQACDLFCLPSSGPGETWGLAINEAMASGKPVLGSDKVGAAVDLVAPGRNGAIFKALSLADLIYNLNKLTACGKSELSKMGKHSKEIIETYSFENQVKVIEAAVNNG